MGKLRTKTYTLRDGQIVTCRSVASKMGISVSAARGRLNRSDDPKKNQKWCDQLFRDINIHVNGFKIINYGAYYALRLGGWMAWKKHRKVNAQWDDGLK